MYRFWRNRIIDIYIMKEVLLPYLAGVAIVTVIGLSSFLFQLTDLIIVKDIPINVVLKLLFYQLPYIIVQSFPIAILFATLYGMSRLNRENEFTALRLGGISLYRLILPLIILGIVISGLTYYINEEIVPWTHHEAQNIIRINILKQPLPDVQDNVFFKGPEGRLFFVNKYKQEEGLLERIIVYELPVDEDYPVIITARSARILGNKWRLEGGIIHKYNEEGELYQALLFDTMEYEIASEVENFYGEQRTTAEMNRKRLKKEIDLFQRSGINVDSLLIDYHLKLTTPLSALIFILIGTPLSLSSKDSRSVSIVFTIVIVFLYYLILSISQSFGKNGKLDPLLAAWLPNIIFGLIGLILLLGREKWQNWLDRLHRFMPFLLVFYLLISFSLSVEAETFNIYSADRLTYDHEKACYELSGEILGQYGLYHIQAETIKVMMADGTEEAHYRVDEINIDGGKLTGCDLDKPHYYLDAKEVIIYPGDYLIAKHVVFRELNGKLPLFYTPYLYISLKEREQNLILEPGYSASRGWFLKATYRYWYQDQLPGELYLDYYTISGLAGGFKQHFLYEKDLKGYLYLYGQENRTDIPGLFNWQGELRIDNNKSQWETDTFIRYINYDDYFYTNGRVNLTNRADTWSLDLRSYFLSRDYYESDHKDNKDLDFDLIFDKNLPGKWRYHLDLYRDYRYKPEEPLKQRWGGSTYLARNLGRLDYRITLERRAPTFTEAEEEDQVSYYRLPEFSLNYRPAGPWSFDFKSGRYYEDRARVEGLRSQAGINYRRTWPLYKNSSFTTEQNLSGSIYRILEDKRENNFYGEYREEEYSIFGLPYQVNYSASHNLQVPLYPGLSWNTKYTYRDYWGDSPFTFDSTIRERVDTYLRYNRGGLYINLASGYDIYNLRYLPITATLRWQIRENWNLNIGTSYTPLENTFGDFVLTNKYKAEPWEINTGLRYDLNNKMVKELDNQLIFDLEDEWYLELNSRYDYRYNELRTANLALRKVFHCRSLTFRYDYVKQEYSLEYNINLFPGQSFSLGRSRDNDFIFDLGLDELLGKE